MTVSRRHLLEGLAGAALGVPLFARAAGNPATIRIAVAQPLVGQPPSFSGSSAAIAHSKGWIDEEFKADGIAIEWSFFKGAGPAVNEAVSNQQVDFALQGDLPSLIGRAAGLKTRLVVATGARTPIYIGVPPDSPAKRIEDLRGKRVALFKGTNMHLPAVRLLEAHGLTERDLKIVNFDTASSLAALATRDIDASIGSQDILRLRDKGQVRVLYTSKGDSPIYTRQSHLLVTERFADAHPAATQRVVKALVKSARWASDEANREEVLRLWARAGTSYEHWKEDVDGQPLRVRLNPTFDPFLRGRYHEAVENAYRLKLSRAKFDVNSWIDTRYLDAALKEAKLENYWPVFEANGKAAGA
ncbi:ABC transporter substrate-binding protein [Piscinibacter gummiphilus]|uniref:Nitrate ABC transporter substrate-binding protein n=1 Tax=Piscinibacter gummiphilus TaxID=946333 RepID=A0A1W6LA05_9BURK|nr:ABC transporter substrate-binding protein [Piscinibacter gummiphilus]ARN21131.1 nitrate ABC transporter substrate-binding protein [Piscinibacter gummiphilus]ATU65812.1 nitrate ABC transporter substrate-binding protein [Piscinibacter gummiphilus]